MQILLVEDDRNLRGFLKKAFREEGCAVDECESGDRALDRALRRSYDCSVLVIPNIYLRRGRHRVLLRVFP